MTTTFGITADKKMKVMIILTMVVICYLSLSLIFKWGTASTGAGMLIVILIAHGTKASLMPIKLKISGDQFIIHRLFRPIIIPIQDIQRVDPIHHDLLKGRVMPAYGHSKQHDTDLGKIVFYTTRRNNHVLNTLSTKEKIMVAPDDRELFIEELERRMKS